MDEQSSVVLIQALAAVWATIRRFSPDVPGVVLLPAPAPPGRRGRNVLGYFAPLRWRVRGDEGTQMHEVVVVAEHLNRGAEDVIETLLHEAAHAMNFARGIKDCTASQYHNRRFAEAAKEVGLEATQVKHYGFALTRMLPETAERYREHIAWLDAVLMHRRSWFTGTPTTGGKGTTGGSGTSADKPKSRYLKATCQCGFNIRAARSTFDSTVIRCESCDSPFERV